MMMQGRIDDPAAPGKWGRRVKDVGRLAYLIRADRLSNFSQHQLPGDVMTALDTYKLSALQVRTVTDLICFLVAWPPGSHAARSHLCVPELWLPAYQAFFLLDT